MTARSRRSTQKGTGAGGPERQRALFEASTKVESWEVDATEVTPQPAPGPPVEQATPTRIDTPPPGPPAGPQPGSSSPRRPAREMSLESALDLDLATPTSLAARPERSEPIRVISMKDQAGAGQPRIAGEQRRVPLHVQLRTMAEVAGMHDAPNTLGRLAPPHDPMRARKRHRRDNLVWACVAIVLAGGISLAIWLIAGR
jgi:hypothetical protein